MAKKAKLQVDSPAQPVSDPIWQARDDAHDIMRYATLKQDKSRHGRAMQHIRAAAELDDNDADDITPEPRKVSRAGKRATTRKTGRR